jgi:DNA invertase Pin-like site-specific DNA recombinase
MLVAAVYARKSTEQAVTDEEKSVTRQVESAVACAKTHGFDVLPEHVYVDDAISGAEFDRRPGLVRLLNALRPRAPFAGLFLADKDRLGREQFETNHILKQISLAGVRIFEFQNGGQEVRLDSPIDNLIMSVSNFAAELERAKASQRTRDALRRSPVAAGAAGAPASVVCRTVSVGSRARHAPMRASRSRDRAARDGGRRAGGGM